MYHYSMIRQAAVDVQSLPNWKYDSNIQKLDFSNHWVCNFLNRGNFTKNTVTTGLGSKRPTDLQIIEHMKTLPALMKKLDVNGGDISNWDQCCNYYNTSFRWKYIQKGSSEKADDLTESDGEKMTAFLGANAMKNPFNPGEGGEVCPPFLVVKCSTEGADLSNTRVRFISFFTLYNVYLY